MKYNEVSSSKNLHTHAKLMLSEEDQARIVDFFVLEWSIDPHVIVKQMYLEIYYANVLLPEIPSVDKNVCIELAASDTRFIVVTPQKITINQQDDVIPSDHKIGIRVHRQSAIMPIIKRLRECVLPYESASILKKRKPSTLRKNAFGRPHYLPHVIFLRSNNGINNDLSQIGKDFRDKLGILHFSRIKID